MAMKKYDVAIECFENLIELKPQNHKIWFDLEIRSNLKWAIERLEEVEKRMRGK